MIDLIPYDSDNPDHAKALGQLAWETGKTLLSDRRKDPILFVRSWDAFNGGAFPTHFLVAVDGKIKGAIGAIVDDEAIGHLVGAGRQEAQGFFPAVRALRMMARYLFGQGVRKIRIEVPCWNSQAEVVCRAVGFRKEGVLMNELVYGGVPCNVVTFGLFPHYVMDKVNRQFIKEFLGKLTRRAKDG